MTEKPRENEVDIAKAIGILLVMFGHGIETTFLLRPDRFISHTGFDEWQFIYSFHMPLFFFLSGLVSLESGKRPPATQLSRSGFLIGLALLAHLAGTAVVMFRDYAGNNFDLTQEILSMWTPVVQGYVFNTIIVWFLVSLAIVQGLAYLCLRYRWPAYVFVALVLAGSIVARQFVTENFWQYQSWAGGFLFFMLGAISHKFLRRTLAVPAGALLAIAVVLFEVVRLTVKLNHGCAFSFAAPDCPASNTSFTVFMVEGSFGFLPLFVFTALCGTLATYYLSAFLARTPLAAAFEWLGRHSLEMMLVNGFDLQFINPVVKASHYLGFTVATIVVLTLIAAQIAVMALILPRLKTVEGYLRRGTDWAVAAITAYINAILYYRSRRAP